jgi:uncharacterized protein RhaS with RHS repeats
MYDPTVGRLMQEDPIRFKGGDPNLDRYVGNHPTIATDPSGLIEVFGLNVAYYQEGGQPGYKIEWGIRLDRPLPPGARQVWIITKTERWSVYKKGDGPWQVFPSDGKYEIHYKGDFIPITKPVEKDTSRIYFDPKNGFQWAIFYEKVTKTVGYNSRDGVAKPATNAPPFGKGSC